MLNVVHSIENASFVKPQGQKLQAFVFGFAILSLKASWMMVKINKLATDMASPTQKKILIFRKMTKLAKTQTGVG